MQQQMCVEDSNLMRVVCLYITLFPAMSTLTQPYLLWNGNEYYRRVIRSSPRKW